MLKFLSILIKIIILAVILLILSQFEYNNRKLYTYAFEFFKSKNVRETVGEVVGKKTEKTENLDYISDEDKKELLEVLE